MGSLRFLGRTNLGGKPRLSYITKGLFGFFYLITHYSLLNFRHSSLITHHLKYPTLFGTITHFSSLNIFQLFVGPILVTWSEQNCFVGPTIFSFLISPPSPLLLSQNINQNPASTTIIKIATITTTTKQTRTQL